MFQSDNSIKLQCDFLNQLNYNYLLLSTTATGAFAWNDGSLCDGMYKIDFELESKSLKIATRILK